MDRLKSILNIIRSSQFLTLTERRDKCWIILRKFCEWVIPSLHNSVFICRAQIMSTVSFFYELPKIWKTALAQKETKNTLLLIGIITVRRPKYRWICRSSFMKPLIFFVCVSQNFLSPNCFCFTSCTFYADCVHKADLHRSFQLFQWKLEEESAMSKTHSSTEIDVFQNHD